MIDQLKILVQMQAYDDRIGEKEELKILLPKQLHDLIAHVENAQAKVDELHKAQEEKIRQQKQKEIDIKTNIDLMHKYQTQLAEIKTNKEYKALNAEVTSLSLKNSEFETQILTLMEEETAIKNELKTAQVDLNKAKKDLEEREGELRRQIEEVDKMITEYKEKRNNLGRDLPLALGKRYVLLIKNKNRKAVVFNNNGTCSGCGFRIRPQLVLELEKQVKMIACENCGRILVHNLSDLT
jgi:uncharacterized protein